MDQPADTLAAKAAAVAWTRVLTSLAVTALGTRSPRATTSTSTTAAAVTRTYEAVILACSPVKARIVRIPSLAGPGATAGSPEGATSYTDRRASVGGSRAARTAGYEPATTPSPIATISAVQTALAGTTTVQP